MLHQTLPTFLSICSSSAIPPHSSSSPSPSPSQFQIKREMEGVVETKALKTSFWPEMTMKATQEPVCEDVWVENVAIEDFHVDDLLDFSKDEAFNGDEEDEEEKDFVSISSHEENLTENDNSFSVKDEFGSGLGSELSVPEEEMEQLEWLSRFVEDSQYSLPYPVQVQAPLVIDEISATTPQVINSVPETGFKNPEISTTAATQYTAKARSKRSRAGGRVWSLGSSSSGSETSGSSFTSMSSGSSRSTSSCLIFANTTPNLEFVYHYDKPPVKKQKRRRGVEGLSGCAQMQRRCSHCGVQKTPQWRAGPEGAKTLCNACGVRFKSGRLWPEYRPACSPTFSSEVHSNNHRKVLEMRRKKESGLGFGPPVRSF